MWVWFLMVVLMMVVAFLAIGTVLYSSRLSGNTTTIKLESKTSAAPSKKTLQEVDISEAPQERTSVTPSIRTELK